MDLGLETEAEATEGPTEVTSEAAIEAPGEQLDLGLEAGAEATEAPTELTSEAAAEASGEQMDLGLETEEVEVATEVPTEETSEAAGASEEQMDLGVETEAEAAQETFEIPDWTGYPDDVPKPEGSFRLLEGEEYERAREEANKANQELHKLHPEWDGLEIHEIKPVKFGGSPTDIANKIALAPEKHAGYTVFWNNLLRRGV